MNIQQMVHSVVLNTLKHLGEIEPRDNDQRKLNSLQVSMQNLDGEFSDTPQNIRTNAG